MTIGEDQLKETKASRIWLEGIGKLLQRLYYEGLIIIILLIFFGCSFQYMLYRIMVK